MPYRIGQIGTSGSWGQYGGSYGYGGHMGGHRDTYNYWGFDRHRRPMNTHKPTGIMPQLPGTSYGMYFWYILRVKTPDYSNNKID